MLYIYIYIYIYIYTTKREISTYKYANIINIIIYRCHRSVWWSYESDRYTCHTKISMTQGLTANYS